MTREAPAEARPRASRPNAAARAAALALAFFAGQRSCGVAYATPQDTLRYALSGEVDSLDPHWLYDGISQLVQWQVYETLVTYRGGSVTELDALLADRVPTRQNALVSPDGLRYTFPIRAGVLFHDGSPLTPEDVKYSLLRLLLMDRTGGPSGLLLKPILGIESTRGRDGRLRAGLFEAADQAVRVEGRAVTVELREPFAPLLAVLAGNCPVVPKGWTAARGGWDGKAGTWAAFNDPPRDASALAARANGTGPFRLESFDRARRRVVLARNERYWRGPPKLARLVFETVDDPAQRLRLLEKGEADAAMLERPSLPRAGATGGVVVDDDLPLLEAHNAFVFNLHVDSGSAELGSGRLDGEGIPPDFYSDADVRRAFAHAFDYAGYIEAGYHGKATRARGPIPPGVFGYDPDVAPPGHDPSRAAGLLKRAWGGKPWSAGFKLACSFEQGHADRELACRILKRSLEALNGRFHLEIRPIPSAEFLARLVAGRLPLVNARWGLDYPDPHNAVHPFLHSEGYYARAGGYFNPRADRLVEAAARELEPDRRALLYRELAQLAAIELPAVFTVDTYYARVRREAVKGWEYNPILGFGYFYPVSKEEP